jgi:anion-transporting  ArsA/GET3 family ATPase
LAKIGPIKTQSDGVAAVLRSPVTSVHVVTMLEEMPAQETADAVHELQRLELPVGNVIINATQPPLLAKGKLSQTDVRRGLAAAGLPTDRDVVSGLVTEAKAHLARRQLEGELRTELATLGRPLIELPALPDGIDQAGLYQLAGVLLGAKRRGSHKRE